MDAVENTTATEEQPRRSLSLDQAVEALRASRQSGAEQPQPDTEPEETEVEPAEVEDQKVEVDAAEDDPDQAGADAEEDAGTDENDDDVAYEIGDEVITLSELKELKKAGMRQEDYTRKTQAISRDRESLVQERQEFETLRQQANDQLQQQNQQLTEALSVFAIEQPKKPVRSDFNSTDEYLLATESYDKQLQRKQEAAQLHQALTQRQQAETQQREVNQALQYFPEWSTDEGWSQAIGKMSEAAKPYGFTQEEILHGGSMDHRTFRVLTRLAELEALVGDQRSRAKVAAKKVVKARSRLAAGAKQSESDGALRVKQAKQKLKSSGSKDDALAAMRAARLAGKSG